VLAALIRGVLEVLQVAQGGPAVLPVVPTQVVQVVHQEELVVLPAVPTQVVQVVHQAGLVVLPIQAVLVVLPIQAVLVVPGAHLVELVVLRVAPSQVVLEVLLEALEEPAYLALVVQVVHPFRVVQVVPVVQLVVQVGAGVCFHHHFHRSLQILHPIAWDIATTMLDAV
jgi:hypothetical protein